MTDLVTKNIPNYELVDSGNGRKLEKILVSSDRGVIPLWIDRPSPQAIWSPRFNQQEWKKATSKVIRKKDGGGKWEHRLPEPKNLVWNFPGAEEEMWHFRLQMTPFGHIGIFFEQIPFWQKIWDWMKVISATTTPRFLNLFGYTGAHSIAAAKAGAEVWHVDSSRGALQWAEENRQLNNFPAEQFHFIHQDAFRFIKSAAAKKQKFNGIFLDPPSWGHGAKKEKWEFDQQIQALLDLCMEILEPSISFLIMTCHTEGIQKDALANLVIANGTFSQGEAGDLGIVHHTDPRVLPAGIFLMAERL
jgi:23S rRNA (cytosine1962-C5)-methyltransferase